MVPRVGQNARQRVELDDHRATIRVAAYIDTAPVAAFQGVVRSERGRPNFLGETLGDAGRALVDLQRIARSIPDPLCLIAVNRWRSLGQHIKTHADDRQTARFFAVAQDGDGELLTGQIGLDDYRLGVGGEQMRDLPHQLRAILTETPSRDALARPLEGRLDEEREWEIHAPGIVRRSGNHEGRVGYAVIGEDLLGSTLVKRETTGEGIRGVIRDPEELADCRNVGFAARSVEAFGDVEDEVWTEQVAASGKAAVG